MLRSIGSVAVLALLMAGCGGGGGNSGSPPSPPPATYTVGGTVTGLSSPGLVLNSDFGGDLAVSAPGSFTFGTRLPVGSKFNVGVKNQPASSPAQHCQVTNGVGTIAAANVTNVDVACASAYTIGGIVSGLTGSGLVLQQYTARTLPCGAPKCGSQFIPFGPPLRITSNGAFSFSVDDSVYPGNAGSALVRISSEPASPSQLCRIHTGWFTPPANKTDIEVSCTQNSYVANAGDNTVSVYSVDAASGALTAVGPPVATGRSPHAIAATGDFVFVANEGSNDISAFAADFATGALTPVPGSPFPAGTDPKSVALFGTYLYVANAGSDTVSAFAIDSNGSLTPLSTSPATFATGKGPASIAIDPNRMTLYVANNGGSNDVSVFSIDPSQGSLAPVAGSPFGAGANPLSLTLEATGNFLYTANPDATNPSISGFRLDVATGALTTLNGSPFPVAVSHDITGRMAGYLYVTTGAGVVGYGIDGMTGALTALPGFPIGGGANAYSMSIDPANQFFYVANDGAASVSGFRLNASTGALTPMSGSPFPAGNHPQFVATP